MFFLMQLQQKIDLVVLFHHLIILNLENSHQKYFACIKNNSYWSGCFFQSVNCVMWNKMRYILGVLKTIFVVLKTIINFPSLIFSFKLSLHKFCFSAISGCIIVFFSSVIETSHVVCLLLERWRGITIRLLIYSFVNGSPDVEILFIDNFSYAFQ